MSRPLAEVLKEGAEREFITDTTLRLDDWQQPQDKQEGTIDFVNLSFDAMQEQRLDIDVRNEAGEMLAHLWLELQNGMFLVHAYDAENDVPVTLAITGKEIRIDDQRS